MWSSRCSEPYPRSPFEDAAIKNRLEKNRYQITVGINSRFQISSPHTEIPLHVGREGISYVFLRAICDGDLDLGIREDLQRRDNGGILVRILPPSCINFAVLSGFLAIREIILVDIAETIPASIRIA